MCLYEWFDWVIVTGGKVCGYRRFASYQEISNKTQWTESKMVAMWNVPWWRHQMETFSALLALCAENSPVTGEFPSQMAVTRSFDVFFHLCLNKRHRAHYEVIVLSVDAVVKSKKLSPLQLREFYTQCWAFLKIIIKKLIEPFHIQISTNWAHWILTKWYRNWTNPWPCLCPTLNGFSHPPIWLLNIVVRQSGRMRSSRQLPGTIAWDKSYYFKQSERLDTFFYETIGQDPEYQDLWRVVMGFCPKASLIQNMFFCFCKQCCSCLLSSTWSAHQLGNAA